MDKRLFRKRPRLNMVYTRSVFIVSVFVMVITILAVWLLGLGQHRTLYVNSLLSVSILSAAFLLYIVSGLYRGIKLKDNVGPVFNRFKFFGGGSLRKMFSKPGRTGSTGSSDFPLGCIGDLFDEVFLWLLAAVVAVFLLWLIGNMLWITVLVFMAMLYWIFFRAMRLVFRKSPLCQGHLFKSILYGTYYTVLYNCWIYGIIIGAHWLVSYRY